MEKNALNAVNVAGDVVQVVQNQLNEINDLPELEQNTLMNHMNIKQKLNFKNQQMGKILRWYSHSNLFDPVCFWSGVPSHVSNGFPIDRDAFFRRP